MHYAFTTRYGRRVSALQTKVAVFSLASRATNSFPAKEYAALWDTGATNTAISRKVAEELDLKPIGTANVYHAGGASLVNAYLVNIGLPSRVMVGNIKVTDIELIDNDTIPEDERIQVIVGMDIIGEGDLAVTNVGGKTALSFRMPSIEEIDFVSKTK